MKHSTATVGALCSAIAFLFFTAFDTLAKILSQNNSVFLIMAISYAAGSLIMVCYTQVKYKSRSADIFKIHKPKLHLARGITQIIGQSCVYMALPYVTLAEFYVVIFTMPVIVIVISSITLKEHIKPFVWLVLLVNFIGVLIALRPDHGVNPWMLLLFVGTVTLSCSLVLLRKMMQTESTEMTSITTTAFLAIGAIIPAVMTFQGISTDAFLWMIAGGVLVSFAQILLSQAYKLAPTAYSSPPQFLQLVYGAIAGYLAFGDVPSMWIYIGGTIVIIANISLILSQSRREIGQNG